MSNISDLFCLYFQDILKILIKNLHSDEKKIRSRVNYLRALRKILSGISCHQSNSQVSQYSLETFNLILSSAPIGFPSATLENPKNSRIPCLLITNLVLDIFLLPKKYRQPPCLLYIHNVLYLQIQPTQNKCKIWKNFTTLKFKLLVTTFFVDRIVIMTRVSILKFKLLLNINFLCRQDCFNDHSQNDLYRAGLLEWQLNFPIFALFCIILYCACNSKQFDF